MTEAALDNSASADPSDVAAAPTVATTQPGPSDTPGAETSIATAPAPAPVAPQTWPDDWRQKLVGDDPKELALAERFNALPDLWKSYREGQKTISGHTPVLEKPTEHSTEEQVTAYRKANDIPQEFKDYSLDFDDGTVVGDDIRGQVDNYLEFAHKNNLSQSQVTDTLKWYMKDIEGEQEALRVFNDEARINGSAALRSEWGGEFEGNINAINSLFTEASEGTMEALMQAAGSDGLKFANDPNNIRWLVALAKQLNPTASLVPPGPDVHASIDTEIDKIEALMWSKDPKEKAKYWKDQGMQDRYSKLTAAKAART